MPLHYHMPSAKASRPRSQSDNLRHEHQPRLGSEGFFVRDMDGATGTASPTAVICQRSRKCTEVGVDRVSQWSLCRSPCSEVEPRVFGTSAVRYGCGTRHIGSASRSAEGRRGTETSEAGQCFTRQFWDRPRAIDPWPEEQLIRTRQIE